MDRNYKVNLIRESMPNYDEYCRTIKVIWDKQWMTNSGSLHDGLEEKLKEYLGVNHCLLYTNGHMALESALQSLKLKGEVITTPFTFISTAESIMRSGLRPRFVDIDPKRLTIDPLEIEKAITDKTSAILGVHVYGIPCDVYSISEIAKRYGLKVIYDSAHSFGSKLDGVGIGTFGDMSAFSLHATKVFNTAEGGAVTFSDDRYYSNLKNVRNFGFNGMGDAEILGFNAKMSEFHAAVGLCNLKKIDEWILQRKKICEQYDEYFSNCEEVLLPEKPAGLVSNYPYYPIILSPNSIITRDKLFIKLDNLGIQTRKYFYPLVNDFTCIDNNLVNTIDNARSISNRVLCLPLYPDLGEEQIKYVIDTVRSLVKNGA